MWRKKTKQNKARNVFSAVYAATTEKKKKMLCRAAVCAVIVSNYVRGKLSLPVMKNIFSKNFLLHLRV